MAYMVIALLFVRAVLVVYMQKQKTRFGVEPSGKNHTVFVRSNIWCIIYVYI